MGTKNVDRKVLSQIKRTHPSEDGWRDSWGKSITFGQYIYDNGKARLKWDTEKVGEYAGYSLSLSNVIDKLFTHRSFKEVPTIGGLIGLTFTWPLSKSDSNETGAQLVLAVARATKHFEETGQLPTGTIEAYLQLCQKIDQ